MSTTLIIIIPYWHGDAYFPACLQSIAGSTFEDEVSWSLLIVHNGGSAPPVPPEFVAQVTILKTVENIGFARAINVGLQYTFRKQYDFIALLNQDTILHTHCLQLLIRATDISPAFYTPLIMNYDMDRVPSWYAMKYYPHISFPSKGTIHELQSMSATCVLGTQKSFLVGGFFDPVFYMYYEDDDYFSRFRSKGGKLFLVTSAKVGHFGGSTESLQKTSALRKRTGVLKYMVRHSASWALLKKLMRHYGSCILRLDFRRLFRYLHCDAHMLPMVGYLRTATYETIQTRAQEYIQSDANP
ncbi:MAG TPA: glycosyltransferase family 2 protein [Saprospiraceae bacterium]|nr:glycosyltransferase family 2 protein [Saprospiraceae bacterium]